jgi:hypothetical protein
LAKEEKPDERQGSAVEINHDTKANPIRSESQAFVNHSKNQRLSIFTAAV